MKRSLRIMIVLAVLGSPFYGLATTKEATASHLPGFRLPFSGHASYYSYNGHGGGNHSRDIQPKPKLPDPNFPDRWDGVVRAAANGVVIGVGDWTFTCTEAPWNGPQKRIVIEHTVANGSIIIRYVSRYEHLSRFSVAVGQQVRAGQAIGFYGKTGCAVAEHLHFQVEQGGAWCTIAYGPAPDNVDDLNQVNSVGDAYAGTYGDAIGPAPPTGGFSNRGDGDDCRPMAHGTTLNGWVDPAGDQDAYWFNGTAGQTATIRMNKVAGSPVDSYLSVYGPAGALLNNPAVDDDRGGNLNALATVRLATTGRYRIQAKGYGTGLGGYTLNLGLQSTDANPTYRIELKWGLTPRDLDAKLQLPDGRIISYSNRGSTTGDPWAQLDRDDRDGFGPEVISISKRLSGTYILYADNYSKEALLAGSGAVVHLSSSAGQVVTCGVPSSGGGTRWEVLRMNADGTIRCSGQLYTPSSAARAAAPQKDRKPTTETRPSADNATATQAVGPERRSRTTAQTNAKPNEPTVQVSRAKAAPTARLTISGTGFPPESDVTVSIDADGPSLTTAEVGQQGQFRVVVIVPPNSKVGPHFIIVSDTRGTSARVPFEVTDGR